MIQGIDYLDPILVELVKRWPNNKTVNIVCHGHSVPSGYFATPLVNTFSAYPHLLHKMIKERFPFAVTNVIVTAIGGENSVKGERRFRDEVLTHRPSLVTIDYSLNDRGLELSVSEKAWRSMIEAALEKGVKVILCTPTWDSTYLTKNESWDALVRNAEQVRRLADEYNVGLADSFRAYEKHISEPMELSAYLSLANHPTLAGHTLVAEEIAKYFIAK